MVHLVNLSSNTNPFHFEQHAVINTSLATLQPGILQPGLLQIDLRGTHARSLLYHFLRSSW